MFNNCIILASDHSGLELKNKLCDYIKLNIKDLSKKVEKKLGLPVFIKPSNSGSSVGVNKAHD